VRVACVFHRDSTRNTAPERFAMSQHRLPVSFFDSFGLAGESV